METATAAPNRKYKDSMITALFGTPEKSLEIYNAIKGTNYSDPSKVKIVTLPNVLYGEQLNDIAFTIEGKLVVLMEHQSTLNKNMPLRMLLYIGREYEMLTDRRDLYMVNMKKIPAPEFIVLYNGTAEMDDYVELRLSDMFEMGPDSPNLELVVKAYNINKGRNVEIAARSRSLSDYEEFIADIRLNLKTMPLSEAIKASIRSFLGRGIFVDFLTRYGSEVENMLFQEWNWDEALAVRFDEGVAKGHDELFALWESGISLGEAKQKFGYLDKAKPHYD